MEIVKRSLTMRVPIPIRTSLGSLTLRFLLRQRVWTCSHKLSQGPWFLARLCSMLSSSMFFKDFVDLHACRFASLELVLDDINQRMRVDKHALLAQ